MHLVPTPLTQLQKTFYVLRARAVITPSEKQRVNRSLVLFFFILRKKSARYAKFESRKRSLDHNQPLSIRDDGPDLPVCSSGQNLRLSPHQKEAKTKVNHKTICIRFWHGFSGWLSKTQVTLVWPVLNSLPGLASTRKLPASGRESGWKKNGSRWKVANWKIRMVEVGLDASISDSQRC